MKPSEDLFELIKSLNKSEKRYFHIFAAKNEKGKDKNYIKLFNKISKMDDYDETALKEKLKGELFVKQLHVTKNYLFKMIMKSLSSVYTEKSERLQVKELIQEAGILYEKLLYRQSEKLLHKAKKIALKFEMYEQILEINQTLVSINTNATGFKKEFKYEIGPFIKEQAALLKKLSEMYKYHFTYLEMSYFHKKTMFIRGKKNRITADSIFNKQKKLTLRNIRIAPYAFGLNFIYFNYIDDNQSAFKICTEYISDLESHKEYCDENPHLYIRALQAASIVTRNLIKYDSQHDILKKLKKLYDNKDIILSKRIKNLLRDTIDETELFLHLETFELEKAFEHLKNIDGRMRVQESKFPVYKKGLYFYTFSYVYFLFGKFKDSLFWLNKLINIEERKSIENVFLLSQLLSCFIHFEQKDFELVLSRISSIGRYLQLNKLDNQFERVSIEFINKIIKLETNTDKLNKEALDIIYKAFRKKLLEISENKSEQAQIAMLDIVSWIDSKTKGIDLVQAIKLNRGSF